MGKGAVTVFNLIVFDFSYPTVVKIESYMYWAK